VHFGPDSAGLLRPDLEHLAERADLLLIGGDLTRSGAAEEARVLADELRDLPVPALAVLGNHDYHLGQEKEVAATMEEAGITVLEGTGRTFDIGGVSVGVAGVKGFGGGFAGACATEFGEPQVRSFAAEARRSAETLRAALDNRGGDYRVALLHYAPVEGTLVGEHPGLWPFLGSYLLAEAVDSGGAALVIHGHAHHGSPEAVTPGGVPVRNVAQAVIRSPFAVLEVSGTEPVLTG